MSIKDFADAIKKCSPQSVSHTAVPKPDFVRELISTKLIQTTDVLDVCNVIDMSSNMSDFKQNINVFTKENIETIEKLTMY